MVTGHRVSGHPELSAARKYSGHYGPVPDSAGLPGGVKFDAITDDYLVLIKDCSKLRLTHQIRLGTFAAQSERKCLLLLVRKDCDFDPLLEGFVNDQAPLIEVRRS